MIRAVCKIKQHREGQTKLLSSIFKRLFFFFFFLSKQNMLSECKERDWLPILSSYWILISRDTVSRILLKVTIEMLSLHLKRQARKSKGEHGKIELWATMKICLIPIRLSKISNAAESHKGLMVTTEGDFLEKWRITFSKFGSSWAIKFKILRAWDPKSETFLMSMPIQSRRILIWSSFF